MAHVLNYPVERARGQHHAHAGLRFTATPRLSLPPVVDLRPQHPPIVDQGQLGSCTSNSFCSVFEFVQRAQKVSEFYPSRLFHYYCERTDMGTVGQDSGATIAESIKAGVSYGVCVESEWPYNIAQFTAKPPSQAYVDAVKSKVAQYAAVSQDLQSIKGILAGGRPVLFGFVVYQQYENVGADGQVAMPSGAALGGHANHFVGYDDNHRNLDGSLGAFITCNSWGTGWGIQGYGWFPYQYAVSHFVSDLWVLQSVSGAAPPAPPPVKGSIVLTEATGTTRRFAEV